MEIKILLIISIELKNYEWLYADALLISLTIK